MQKIKFIIMNYDIQLRGGEKDKELKQNVRSVEQEITLQLKSGKSKNPLKELTGKWPGDESLEDLLKMLKEWWSKQRCYEINTHVFLDDNKNEID